MYLWIRKNWLNFGRHPLPDPDPGIFQKDSSTLRNRAFSTIWLISLDTMIRSPWKFYRKCMNKEVLVNFWQSSRSEVRIRSLYPYPDSGYGLGIWARFALAEVCDLLSGTVDRAVSIQVTAFTCWGPAASWLDYTDAYTDQKHNTADVHETQHCVVNKYINTMQFQLYCINYICTTVTQFQWLYN